MNLITGFVYLFIASLLLIKAIDWFVVASSKIAHYFKLSGYTISFLLIGMATSLPELIVGAVSAYEKTPIVSYANVIGSNMALLTLIIAIPVLFGAEISTRKIVYSKDLYITLFCFILAIALTMDGKLTKTDGWLLISAYIIYAAKVIRRGSLVERMIDKLENIKIWRQLGIFVASLSIILAASSLIVRSTIILSQVLGWNIAFISITLTAIGTSLPEVAYAIRVMRDPWKRDGILGNILGSVVSNSLLVLGVTAAIHPIIIGDNQINIPTLTILVFTLLLFLRFARTKSRFDRQEALILLGVYALFIVVEFLLTV